MKFMTSALLGLLGGLAVVGVFVFTLLRPTLSPTVTTAGLPTEYLAHGAELWQPVVDPPGGPTARLLALPDGRMAVLAFAGHGAVFDPVALSWQEGPLSVEPGLTATNADSRIFWSPLSPTEALAAYYDDYATGAPRDHAQIFLEPRHEALPALPRPGCEKALGAVRLTGGAVLALAWDGAARKTRTLRLDPGATAWVELGDLPEASSSSSLIAGGGDRALSAGFGERALLFESGAWKPLPRNLVPRYGYRFALGGDGAVLITGGQKDEAKAKSLAFGLLPLLALCALLVVLYVAVVKWQASLAGVALGLALALALTALAFLAFLMLFGWH